MAVNAAPGSPQPRASPTTRRCALEEMGRNSVRPCTSPRTTASIQLIARSTPVDRQRSVARARRGGGAGGSGGAREATLGRARPAPRAARRDHRAPRVGVRTAGRLASRGATRTRAQRPGRLAPGTGHHDLGPGHRRGRGRDAADGLRRRRRHAGRHRRRLRRRGQRAPPGPADGRRRPPLRRAGRHQGRRAHRAGADGPRRVPRAPARRPRRLAGAPGHRPRRPVAAAHLGRDHPAGGDPRRLRHRRLLGPGALRRHQQLHRLADRAGGHLAAGLARPRAAGERPGGGLAAAARRGAGGGARGRGAGPGRAGLVAAGPWAAHRQVPAGRAGRVAGRLAAVAGLHRRAALGDRRPDRGGRGHRRRGAGHHAAGGGAGLGARPPRGHRTGGGRAHRRAAADLAGRRGGAAARGDPHRARGRLGALLRLPRAAVRQVSELATTTDPVFAAFCAAGLWPGLGKRAAAELPAAGITSTDDVTANRLLTLPRVGKQRAERLFSSFLSAQPTYEVVQLLVGAGLDAKLASTAADALGNDAARRLRDDPWALLGLTGVTLGDADRLAIAVLPGADKQDSRRGRAIVAQTLRTATRDGHTVLPADLVVAALRAEGVADPAAAVTVAVESGEVLEHEPPEPEYDEDADLDQQPEPDPALRMLSLARYGMAEEAVAENVARLAATAERIADPAAVRSVAKGLDDAQKQAVAQVLGAGVSLLTGGPGTGKSRTVAAVVTLLRSKGSEVALAAPTGRAAKRLEELTDHPAVTVHRLLGAQGMTGGFSRNEEWPLDEDVVVVDEASMLDVELTAALLEALPDGTHLLLVGDPAQLPSIGPGHVLGDLIDSAVVPVTELTTLYRQAEGGAIARLATAVRGGQLPPVDSPDREVVVVPAAGSAEAAHRVVQLVTDSIPRALGIDPGAVQVVTPVHRGPAGTIELNKALKAQLNPGDGTGDGSLTVDFPSGPVTVTGDALPDLKHGGAITVHRAQGSEWPGVVVVLPPEAGGMLSRPLVYTALTRAQRHLSIVPASGAALARAVREVDVRPRRTRLARLLAENAG